MAFDPVADLGPDYMVRMLRRMHTSGPATADSIARAFARVYREAQEIAVQETKYALKIAVERGYAEKVDMRGDEYHRITVAGISWLWSVGR